MTKRKWLLAFLSGFAMVGVLYAEYRGQPRYIETRPWS